MKVSTSGKLGALLLASMAAPCVFAQSFTASNTTAVINSNNHTVTVTLDPAAATVDGVELTVGFNTAHLTLPAAAEIVSSASQITCAVNSPSITCSGFGIPAGVQTIQIPVDIGADEVLSPGSPVTVTGTYREPTNGDAVPTALNNGSVTIITAQPDVNLVFAPAPGATVSFPAGVAGSVQNASIGITTTGTVGSGTVSNCAVSGTGASSFTAPAGTITVNGGDTGSIPLTCTLPASGGAATATLTCTETDADTPSPGAARTWNLSCPQGSAVPANPVITTVTPTGAFAMPAGTIGQTVTRPIQFSAAGGVGTGSATIACSGAAPLTIAPTSQTVTGSNQPTPVSVSIPLTASAQGPITVTCTVTDLNGTRTDTFDVTAAAGTALPPPSVVPASSMLSQLILIALLAGLGVAVVGFRRS